MPCMTCKIRVNCWNKTFGYNFQWIAHGPLGDLGAHVQSHVAQELSLSQDPRLGRIMVEMIAQDHQPRQLHAVELLVVVNSTSTT